jgi:cation transporter-like permease
MESKTLREILTAEFLSVCGGLVAGTLLSVYVDKIYLLPAVFIFFPGFLEMRGGISGSLAARLTSGLFVRAIKPEIKKSRILYGNIMAAIVLAILVSLCLGIIASAANFLLFGEFSMKIVLVAVIAGTLSSAVSIPLTVFAVFYLFKRGNDPNNVIGPYVTVTGDIISILSLLAAVVMM